MLTSETQILQTRIQLSLGKALAIIKSRKGNYDPAPDQFDERAWLYLNHLRNRLIWLTSENHRLVELERSIPTAGCTAECFLEKHDDFFVAYLMECFPPNARNEKNLCARLIKHLNNCYPCFCIYATVMRDFYHEIG